MPSSSSNTTRQGRSPVKDNKKSSYLNKSPVRTRGVSPKQMFAKLDDAIEHGATEDAKQKAAAERARLAAGIPARSKSPKPSSGGWGKPLATQRERKENEKLEEEERQRNKELLKQKRQEEADKEIQRKKRELEKRKKQLKEEERQRKIKLEEEEQTRLEKEEKEAKKKKKMQPEKEQEEKEEQSKKRQEAAAQKELSKKQKEEQQRQAKKEAKERQKKQQDIETKRNKAASSKHPTAPQRVPKRSALLAMGGKDAEEYKKMKEAQALATWTNDPDGRWEIVEHTFDGVSSSETKETQSVDCDGSSMTLAKGIENFKKNPEKYVAIHYHPQNPYQFTYILRAGTTGYKPEGLKPSGGQFTILRHMYKRLAPLEDDVLPKNARDKYTDIMTYRGKKLHSKTKKPILPGRGMGIGDAANMKLIGDYPEPDDVFQGTCVGDCWLLSAIACLGDYDWAVERLFRKTMNPSFKECPVDKPNQYTVTLWDLKTWAEVDVVIDERLPIRPDGSGFLLGAKPSRDGKLWVPYLEKAIAVHCGGWDKLEGGQCTAAWPMMTGSRNQFIITNNPKTGKYYCGAKYNPQEENWSEHSNSPHDSDARMWKVDWPKIGGGGSAEVELTQDQLFQKIVAWDENNFLVGAGTDGTSDEESTEGVVDNHAYSVIDCRQNVCGTGVDLLLLRNPWGKGGGLENGQFVRNGPGWGKYPPIRKELNPIMEDNGLFWVTKGELFQYYQTIYLCAMNMTRLQEKNYVNDLEDDFPRGKNKKSKPKPKPKRQAEEFEIVPLNIDSVSDPNSAYKIVKQQYNGAVSYDTMNKDVIKGRSLEKAVKEFKENPEKYLAIHYQTSTVDQGWPDEVHQFTFIYRGGTNGMLVEGVCDSGKRTILTNVLR